MKPYCYVTATNNYPSLVEHGGKTLKIVIACSSASQAKAVETKMAKRRYYIRISRSKNKPYYDKKRYATRYYANAEKYLKP